MDVRDVHGCIHVKIAYFVQIYLLIFFKVNFTNDWV